MIIFVALFTDPVNELQLLTMAYVAVCVIFCAVDVDAKTSQVTILFCDHAGTADIQENWKLVVDNNFHRVRIDSFLYVIFHVLLALFA